MRMSLERRFRTMGADELAPPPCGSRPAQHGRNASDTRVEGGSLSEKTTRLMAQVIGQLQDQHRHESGFDEEKKVEEGPSGQKSIAPIQTQTLKDNLPPKMSASVEQLPKKVRRSKSFFDILRGRSATPNPPAPKDESNKNRSAPTTPGGSVTEDRASKNRSQKSSRDFSVASSEPEEDEEAWNEIYKHPMFLVEEDFKWLAKLVADELAAVKNLDPVVIKIYRLIQSAKIAFDKGDESVFDCVMKSLNHCELIKIDPLLVKLTEIVHHMSRKIEVWEKIYSLGCFRDSNDKEFEALVHFAGEESRLPGRSVAQKTIYALIFRTKKLVDANMSIPQAVRSCINTKTILFESHEDRIESILYEIEDVFDRFSLRERLS